MTYASGECRALSRMPIGTTRPFSKDNNKKERKSRVIIEYMIFQALIYSLIGDDTYNTEISQFMQFL